MLSERDDRKERAQAIAHYSAKLEEHKSHSLGIDRDRARAEGVVIEDLEGDQALQDAVLSAHHATMHTLAGPAVKIVENHLGRTYAKAGAAVRSPDANGCRDDVRPIWWATDPDGSSTSTLTRRACAPDAATSSEQHRVMQPRPTPHFPLK